MSAQCLHLAAGVNQPEMSIYSVFSWHRLPCPADRWKRFGKQPKQRGQAVPHFTRSKIRTFTHF
jgi:hypothetical protein